MKMYELTAMITLTEEMLGMSPSNPNVHEEYIASKAPDAPSREEEIEVMGVDEVVEMGKTIFPKGEDNKPFLWDYQVKGFLKDAVNMLRRSTETKCAKIKAYKKIIDGNIFIRDRRCYIEVPKGCRLGDCQRPLRANTPQGERVALANSETVPAGSTIKVTFLAMNKTDLDWIRECLDYGVYRGLGQWRNSGKGTFTWEEVE